MLFFILLGYLSFAVLEAGPAEGTGGTADMSPREGLRGSAEKITRSPLRWSRRCAVSEELAKDFDSLLELTLTNIHEFAQDYDGCLRALKPLVEKDVYMDAGSEIQSYKDRYQTLEFLALRIEGNRFLLRRMELTSNIWSGAGPSLFDALARLLRTGAEALQMRCKVKLHVDHILCSKERLFKIDQDAQQGSGSIGDFETLICTDYEELGERLVELLERTLQDFERVLEVLGDIHHGDAYQLFKRGLEEGFESLFDRLSKSMRRKAGFGSERWRRLVEAQALMRGRVFWAIFAFKRKFPGLGHDGDGKGALFPKRAEFRGAFDEGPPLVGEDLIQKEFGGDAACLDLDGDLVGPSWALREAMGRLAGWTYSLHLRLSNSHTYHCPSGERAKQWLRDVEANLCLVLETIGMKDEQRRRYMLGAVVQDFASIAYDIERIVGEGVRSEQDKDEPGHFCRKLAQMIENTCFPSRAPSTGGIEPLHVADTKDVKSADSDGALQESGDKTDPICYEQDATITPPEHEGEAASTGRAMAVAQSCWSYGPSGWARRMLLGWYTGKGVLWIGGQQQQRCAIMILLWLTRIISWSMGGPCKRRRRR